MKENRIAAHAGLDPKDPRWVLAMQTQARLQGATLTPERREQLIRNGAKLGLRPFESNLVIAIVQDRARIGAPIDHSGPILSLVRQPGAVSAAPRNAATWPRWFAAIAFGLALAGLLIRWLSSG